MKYYSTNGQAPLASLEKAVVRGLAEDRGLYMPERIPVLPEEFYRNIQTMTFQEIACTVADALFGEDIPAPELHRIVEETLSFDCPVVPVTRSIGALELFHGPTLAFKDVGARFMARLLRHFTQHSDDARTIHVLVATSGDTGSAVANGFLGVEGVHVHVLYPKGKVSPIQECQFTTLGRNITALEVDGCFDDCQALVKSAFMDAELTARLRLTSANSINVARLLPQSFYYFHGYAQMKRFGLGGQLVVCVPSGNFGNLCAALFARRMGLPVKRFIAANNANDVFFEYLQTGEYKPRPSIPTLANAMDVGDPSNAARIFELYGHDWKALTADISGRVCSDDQIVSVIRQCREKYGYLLDPHGACGFYAVYHHLHPGERALLCETAHPAKFKDTVERATGTPVDIPTRLSAFMQGTKQSVPMGKDYKEFKEYLSTLQ
ncbi:MAG: threonine synthase [Bacteroidales bacterium]|jgi:threonine synthase|nr:threonine synthase [Bacteroidales bacterium]